LFIPGKLYINIATIRFIYFNGDQPCFPLFQPKLYKKNTNVIKVGNILFSTGRAQSFQDFDYFEFLYQNELIYFNYLFKKNVMLYNEDYASGLIEVKLA